MQYKSLDIMLIGSMVKNKDKEKITIEIPIDTYLTLNYLFRRYVVHEMGDAAQHDSIAHIAVDDIYVLVQMNIGYDDENNINRMVSLCGHPIGLREYEQKQLLQPLEVNGGILLKMNVRPTEIIPIDRILSNMNFPTIFSALLGY